LFYFFPSLSESQACNTQACCGGAFDTSGDCCALGPSQCNWIGDDGRVIPGAIEPYKWCGHAETGAFHCAGESTWWASAGRTITCRCQ